MGVAFSRAGRKGPHERLADYAREAIRDALAGAEVPELERDYDAEERLEEFARMAISKYPSSLNAATAVLLEHLMDDARAFNALMGDLVRPQAMDYLHRIWNKQHGEHERGKPGSAKNGGQPNSDAQAARAASGGGQATGDAHKFNAPAAPSPERLAAERKAKAIFANGLLSIIKIDGLPIRQCTAGRVLASANDDARMSRWKTALCTGMQPEMVIGQYVDDDRAEELWGTVK
jgi:hypothetical protein